MSIQEPALLIRECTNPECLFRYPARLDDGVFCPKCKGETRVAEPPFVPLKVEVLSPPKPQPIVHAVLENIRSTLNVGSMFRTADGAGIVHLHLCGLTPTPEHPKIYKTGLGAEFSVNWTYHRNGLSACQELIKLGFTLIALEGGTGATPIFDYQNPNLGEIALIVGNEVSGIDPGIHAICDSTLYIPMQGYKRSLNVAVAFGIAAYALRYPME